MDTLVWAGNAGAALSASMGVLPPHAVLSPNTVSSRITTDTAMYSSPALRAVVPDAAQPSRYLKRVTTGMGSNVQARA